MMRQRVTKAASHTMLATTNPPPAQHAVDTMSISLNTKFKIAGVSPSMSVAPKQSAGVNALKSSGS